MEPYNIGSNESCTNSILYMRNGGLLRSSPHLPGHSISKRKQTQSCGLVIVEGIVPSAREPSVRKPGVMTRWPILVHCA
eukprot:2451495-Amphidinium_carterae.1